METKIPFKPSIFLSLSIFALFASFTTLGIYAALREDSWVFWFVAISCSIMSVGGIGMIYFNLTSTKYIVLTEHSIHLPSKHKKQKAVTVNFSDILELNETAVNKTRILYILHVDGIYDFPSSMIPSKKQYELIKNTIANAIS